MMILNLLIKLFKKLHELTEKVGLSIAEDVAKKAILSAVAKSLGTVLGGTLAIWLGAEGVHAGVAGVMHMIAPEKVVVADTSRYVKLSDFQSLAQQMVDNQKALDARADSIKSHDQYLKDKKNQATMDSLDAKYTRLVSVQTATGVVNVSGQATKTDSGVYSNKWVVLKVKNSDVIDFTFLARLKYIEMKMENKNGKSVNLITAYLSSLIDSTALMPLSLEQVNDETPLPPQDLSIFWIDPTLHGAVFYGKAFTFGFAYSPFMVSSGGNEPKAAIIRYPIFSLSSDFKTTTPLLLGIAVNAGHWLPLIKNTYISPNFGIDLKAKKTVFAIGLSTTL